MRPASTSDLSFSSSEASGAPRATYERLGTDSTGLGSWNAGSSQGQSFATPQSYERANTNRSISSGTLREDAFATARSMEPGSARPVVAASSPKKPQPPPQSAFCYPTEDSPMNDEDSPLPPSALPCGLPVSRSMATLPPPLDDRGPPSDVPTNTTTPASSPPFDASNRTAQVRLPPLRLPSSSAPRVTMPVLDAPLNPPSSSSSVSSDVSDADSLASPIAVAASPPAGKPPARQVSFSQPYPTEEQAAKPPPVPVRAPVSAVGAAAAPHSPTTPYGMPLITNLSGLSDGRRYSNSSTSGPTSPPRRKASLPYTPAHAPTRRYTLAPDAAVTLPPSQSGAGNAEAAAAAQAPPTATTTTTTTTADRAPATTAVVSSVSTEAPPEAARSGGLWGWYEAAKQGVYSRQERINNYLDGLIDPVSAGTGGEKSAASPRSPASTGRDRNTEPSALDAITGVPSPRRYGLLYGPENEDHTPYGGDGRQGAPRRLVEQMFLDENHEPLTTQGRMAHLVEINSDDLDDGEATDVDDEQPNFEIDLVSAFHGYRNNPNECFGHLVSAALTSRSQERPVTGAELREAGRNPYLVRLVLSSNSLDFEDPVAVSEVQATLDMMVDEHDPDISPALYEYLVVFFQPPFVRLSHRQYTILKQSGFEYVVLLYHNRHVLPLVHFHSILFNYSTCMRACNLAAMLVSSAAMILQNVAMLLVLANWMIELDGDNQRFGFYTLIVYGCGYAVNLVMLIFLMRTRQDTFLYDESADPETRSDTPSPYVMVVPVLPIFDILCVVQYLRAWHKDRLVAMHNALVSSRLSSICFSVVFSMAQFIAQSYFYHTLKSPDFVLQSDWHYALLAVASTAQWGIALLRFGWMMLSYDSVSGVGFTRFNIPYQDSILERHSAVVHILHYLMVFVLENNIYLLVASALTRADYGGCVFLPNVVIALASVSIFYGLIIYGILTFSSVPSAKVSFTCIPLALLQVAEFVVTIIHYSDTCSAFESRVMRSAFIFGYIHWCGYILVFIVWLLWLAWWIAYHFYNMNLYPRLNGPWKREAHVIEDSKPLDTMQTTTTDGEAGAERAPSGEASA